MSTTYKVLKMALTFPGQIMVRHLSSLGQSVSFLFLLFVTAADTLVWVVLINFNVAFLLNLDVFSHLPDESLCLM